MLKNRNSLCSWVTAFLKKAFQQEVGKLHLGVHTLPTLLSQVNCRCEIIGLYIRWFVSLNVCWSCVLKAFDEGWELLSAARWQRHVTFCLKVLTAHRITQRSFIKIHEPGGWSVLLRNGQTYRRTHRWYSICVWLPCAVKRVFPRLNKLNFSYVYKICGVLGALRVGVKSHPVLGRANQAFTNSTSQVPEESHLVTRIL
jgi:hypothetical protein